MNKRRVKMDEDQTRVGTLPHVGLNAVDVLQLLCRLTEMEPVKMNSMEQMVAG